MSSLQLSLLIAAVVLVCIVVGYNYSQNRKAQARIDQSRAGMASEVAQESRPAKVITRAEPVLDGGNTSASQTLEPSYMSALSDLEPLEVPPQVRQVNGNKAAAIVRDADLASIESAAPAVSEPATHEAAPQGDPYMLRSFGLHPSADCVVDIQFGQAVASERLIAATGNVRRVGAKPVIFEGIAQNGDYEPFVPGERFHGLRAGVLMANRHGPLNAMEFSDFAALVQKIADATGGKVTLPDMNEVLNRARALDAHCAQLDAQVGLNVVTSDALSPADLAAAARDLGLAERGNNRFAHLGEHGEVLFSFSLADSPNRITLLLDVPRAPSANSPWNQMLLCAQRTVARFGGRLVDDADKPLSAEALDRIGNQLSQRYQSLAAASFDAGSPVALRLFN